MKKHLHLTIWVVDPDPPRWALDALHTLFEDEVLVETITTAESWEEKASRGMWADLIITEHDLPWTNSREILQALSRSPTATFTMLLSDAPSDDEIAALFEEGLDGYLRKTPPRPLLLKKRVERLLQYRPKLMQERLRLGKVIQEKIAHAETATEIAGGVLPPLAEFLGAEWGLALLREESSVHMIASWGKRVKIIPAELIGQAPISQCTTCQVPVEELGALKSAFASQGIHSLHFCRLFAYKDAEEWFVFGWQEGSGFVNERKRLTSELIRWIGAASQRAYAESLERAQRQRSEALASLALRLNRPLTDEQVGEEVLDSIKTVAPYDRASVWLWTSKERLRVVAIRGFKVSAEYLQKAVHAFTPPIEEWTTIQIVRHTHRPLILEDVSHFQEWYDVANTRKTASWMGVPIIYDEEVIGMIFLDKFSPNAFSEEQLRAVNELMRAASIAFHNARLFAEQDKWRKRFAALQWIALQMVSTLEPQEVLRQLVDETLRLLEAADVHIFFYNGERLLFVAGQDKEKSLKEPYWEPRPDGITYTALRRREPIIVRDASRHPLYAGAPWEGAIISMPLVVRRRPIGVMNVAWDKPRDFADEEVHLLRSLADYAAIALENARLVSSLEKRVRDLTELARLGEQMRTMRQGKELVQMVVNNAVMLADAEVGMMLRRISDREMVVRAVQGLPQKVAGTVIPSDYGICGKALGAFKTATFHDLHPAELLPPLAEGMPLLKTAAVFPVKPKSNNEPIGCLLVGWKSATAVISAETLNTLQLLISMLANTLERSRAQSELEEAFIQIVTALSRALDERDHYHGDHSERLSRWSELVARELGCSDEEVAVIKQAALLHDIGKIGIPDKVLRKPGPLTAEEWETIKQHPVIGARILRPLERLRPVAEIVEAHHERWNGSGYPRGLKGEEIPLGARIIAVVDSYGAMVDKRVYRAPLSHEEAVEEIRRGAGTLYDPAVVEAFLRVVDSFPDALPSPEKEDLDG